MKRFLYLVGFLVLLLTLKAFYLDPYIEENYGDKNESAEANSTEVTVESETPVQTEVAQPKPAHRENNQSTSVDKAPLEKLGDSIANKLEKKIGKQ